MKKQIAILTAVLSCASFGLCENKPASGRSSNNKASSSSTPAPTVGSGEYVAAAMRRDPWEAGAFVQGGLGTSGEEDDHFLSAGVRLGKVLTDAAGPGVLRGQFEYAASFMPYWQAFTPVQDTLITNASPLVQSPLATETTVVPTGGSYHGVSITPIILRWNLVHWHRVMPWLQGAGGVIWTNHKFPPNGMRGTSVFNFTPQFGVGAYYFLNPGHAISFAANAVHISNASLGDANPGVNATVQFQVGYTWWK